MTPFGAFIAEKRVQRGMTQVQLSQAIDVSSAYVSRVESGLKRPTNSSFLDRVATALRLSDVERRVFLRLAQESRRTVQIPDNTPLRGYRLVSKLASRLPNLTDRQLMLLESVIQLTDWEFCSNEEEEDEAI